MLAIVQIDVEIVKTPLGKRHRKSTGLSRFVLLKIPWPKGSSLNAGVVHIAWESVYLLACHGDRKGVVVHDGGVNVVLV